MSADRTLEDHLEKLARLERELADFKGSASFRINQAANSHLVMVQTTTTSQTGITTEVDITNLVATLAVRALRHIHVRYSVRLASTVAGDTVIIRTKVDGATIRSHVYPMSTVSHSFSNWATYVQDSNATRQYKLTIARNSGTGTISVDNANQIGQMHVEDLGGL